MATQTKPHPARRQPAGADVRIGRAIPGARAESDSAIIERLFDEIRHMSEEHNRGDIDVTIPAARFEGQYRSLAEAINGMVAGHIAVKRKAMACVDEFSKGNFDAVLEAFPGKKAFINESIERLRTNLKLFIEEMNRMSEQHTRGDIDALIPDRFQGDFRVMAQGVNTMVAGHIEVKKKAMAVVAEFGKGNFEAPLERFPGKKAFINDTIEQVRARLKELIADADGLVKAAVAGKLATRADATKHQGDFRRIVEGINQTLDAVIKPLNVSAEYVDRIARGDIPPKITTDYQGDFEALKNNLNTCIGVLNALIDASARMRQAQKAGDTEAFVDSGAFQGAYAQIAKDVNEAARIHIENSLKILDTTSAYAEGDFSKVLARLPGKQAVANEKLDLLRGNLQTFIAEMKRMSDEHNKGDIDVVIPAEKFTGDYRVMVQGVNDMVTGHIAVKRKAMACIAEFGKGNFEAPLERFPGKKAFINETIEQVRTHLKRLVTDVETLITAGRDGKLDFRSDAARHQGDFARIVQGINQTLDAVIEPVKEASQVLAKITRGDLTSRVVGEYRGDHARIKEDVNKMAADLQENFRTLGQNAQALASSSEELTAVSQQMAGSAEETATQSNVVSAASEQVSRNVATVASGGEQMQSSIREIAKNANEAARVAKNAVNVATATNTTVAKLGDSSTEIGNVIKVITSIAQQTNLLALNATIEAARAGEAGKGFAVVANEVKELAKQTARATEEISKKIEAIQTDTKASVLAIGEIGGIITQINDISNSIASAVEEQTVTTNEINRSMAEAAKGVGDITKNITGVALAAKDTTVGANNTQKAAQELSQMAGRLQGLVSRFTF